MRSTPAVTFFLISTLGYAQDVAVLRRGDVHVGGFGGFTIFGGVERVGPSVFSYLPSGIFTPSTNGSIGAQAEYNFTRLLAVQAEYSYMAGGTLIFNQDTTTTANPTLLQRSSVNAHSSARVINLSVVFRRPLESSPRLTPFLDAGSGVVRTHFELQRAVIGPGGATASGSVLDTDLIGSAGGGLRYYFTERLGIGGGLRLIAGPHIRTMGRFQIGVFFKAY